MCVKQHVVNVTAMFFALSVNGDKTTTQSDTGALTKACLWLPAAVAIVSSLCAQTRGKEAVAPAPQVVKLARQYLETTDAAARETLGRELDASDDDPEAVALALKPNPLSEFQAGYFQHEPFRSPELRERYPDARLYYIVPESYRPSTPTGLIVMMHGG